MPLKVIEDFSAEEFLLNALKIEKETAHELARESRIQYLKKNEIISEEQDDKAYFPVLVSGIIAGYLFDEKNGYFDCIIRTPGVGIVESAKVFDSPVIKMYFKALADSAVLWVKRKATACMLSTHFDLTKQYIAQMKRSNDIHREHKHALSCSAYERYLWFLEQYGDIEGKITDAQIAAYLHFTPVTMVSVKKTYAEAHGGK